MTTAVNSPAQADGATKPRWRWRRELLVVAGFGLLTILFTWPLLLNAGTTIPGDGTDGWQMVWNLWWVRYALEHFHNPFHTNLIFYPQGTDLYLHALNALNGVVSLPVQYLASALGAPADGAIAGYNFIILLSFTGGAYGGFCLARYLWSDVRAALLAGLAYGFSTYNFDHLLGHLNLVSSELIPFFILFFLKALHSAPATTGPKWWRIGKPLLLAAIFLIGLTLLELQYVFFVAIFAGLYLLYLTALWIIRRSRAGFQLGTVWIRAIGVFALWGVLISPFLFKALSQALSNPNIVPLRQEDVYSADLLAYFYPSPFHPLWGSAMSKAIQPFTATLIEKLVFPGFTVYLLILVGLVLALLLWRRRSSPELEPSKADKGYRPGPLLWGLMVLAFAVLSFGPRLHINGVQVGPPLPGTLIYHLPLLNISRVPSRFGVVAILGLGLLAAWGLSRVGQRLATRQPLYTGLVVLSLLVLGFELLPTPYPMTAYAVPDFYRQLAADPATDYGVLEVPLNDGKYHYATQYLEAQMTSHKPSLNGYISRNPVFPPYYGVPVFQSFRSFDPEIKPDILPAQHLDVGVLRYFGLRYILIRKDMIAGTERANSFEIVSRLLPNQQPVSDTPQMAAYEIPAGPKAGFFYNLELPDWYDAEKGPDGSMSRWVQGNTAAFDFWSTSPRTLSIEFPIWSFHDSHSVQFVLNGTVISSANVTPNPQTIRLTLPLGAEQNHFEIKIDGKAVSPTAFGPGNDTRLLTIAVGTLKLT